MLLKLEVRNKKTFDLLWQQYMPKFAFRRYLRTYCHEWYSNHNANDICLRVVCGSTGYNVCFVSVLTCWEDFNSIIQRARFLRGDADRCNWFSFRCPHCGNMIPEWNIGENGRYCTACENYLTEFPEEEEEEEEEEEANFKEYLRSYSTRVPIDPKIKRSRKPYLGFELEVSFGDNQTITRTQAAAIIDRMDQEQILSKYDASVDAEFVSRPMLLQDAVNKAETIANYLRSQGFCSWDKNACGFHIHINKKAVKDPYNLMAFFRDNGKILKAISGRTDDHYCSFDPHVIENRNYNEQRDRYSAINFLNRSTIEIRAWRGTLRTERLKCYLELTDFFARWSEFLSYMSWTDISWLVNNELLTSLVRQQGEIDPDLYSFLDGYFKRAKTKAARWSAYKKAMSDFNCLNAAELKKMHFAIVNRDLFQAA